MLPVTSSHKVIKAFENAGWKKDRQSGSHVTLIKPGHPAILTVPHPSDTIKRGTLRSLIRDAGISVEDFVKLMK